MRSSDLATIRLPTCFHPTECPVSCSNCEYSSTVYLLIRVMLLLVRRRPTKPAACHDVPPPSWPCSNKMTSFHPSFARWYATLVPMTPPPTMMTFASLGKEVLDP